MYVILIFVLVVVLLLGYPVLYFLVPNGNLIHEALYLPVYWFRHSSIPLTPMNKEKVSYGLHRQQYYYLFTPPEGAAHKKVLVIYFHGGSWRYGKPSLFKPNASFFVKLGYTVIIPSHRRPPKYKYDGIQEDLVTMLNHIKSKLSDNEWYDYNIILGGMSSGGHLATMIHFDEGIRNQVGFSPNQIKGIFACGAPLNLNLLMDALVLKNFAGPRSGELFQQANPLNHLDPTKGVPFLCFHGEKDAMVPIKTIQPFLKELRQQVPPVIYHPIKEGNHMSATNWLYFDGEERRLLVEWMSNVMIMINDVMM